MNRNSKLPASIAGVLLATIAGVIVIAWTDLDSSSDPPSERREKKTKKKKHDPSISFFAAHPVVRLDIQVEEPHLSELLRDDRTYVRSTVRELDPTGGDAEPTVYHEVGIHLKGARGSYRPFHSKPALTLNFDKFKNKQKFHGIDKLHLNNSVQDPSFLCEFISGELFQAAGVPATRVAFAIVTLNDRPRGFYVLKEGFDPTFLSRHFEDKRGNLYDGGFLNDVDEGVEKTSGTGPDDHSDLDRLVDAASIDDPDRRLAELKKVLDIDRFLSFVAVETLTWHWDGYAMKTNNYRMYNDPTSGQFVFLPHGMDQMFRNPRAPIVPHARGLVARAVLSTEVGSEAYQRRVAELVDRIFTAEALTKRIDEIAPTIREALATLDEHAARRHDSAVADLRHRVAERTRAAREYLGK